MEEVRYVDSSGKKRKGVKVLCDQCKKEFITRKDQPYKHCSEKCKNKSKERKLTQVCAWCKTEFQRKKAHLHGSKSGLFFCTRKCKDEAQRLGGIKEIQPSHYGTGDGRHSYRSLFTDEELICARCGYDEFKESIDIHHIDKDRSNNDKSNLLPLCCNCHNALHRQNSGKLRI